MFEVGAPELLLIVIVAILVIGPKDMPMALRTAGRWIGKMRRMSNHFRSGVETMIREAEMEEMEKKWQEQNRKVMEQHPAIEMTAQNGGGEGLVPQPIPQIEDLTPPASAEARAEAKNPVEPPPEDTKPGGAA